MGLVLRCETLEYEESVAIPRSWEMLISQVLCFLQSQGLQSGSGGHDQAVPDTGSMSPADRN